MTTYTPEAIVKALNAYHGRVRQWDDERKDQMSRALAAADAAMEAAGWVRVRKKAAKCEHPNYTVTVADVFTNECDDCGYVWLTYRDAARVKP